MICINCVKAEPLKKHIALNGQPHLCRYCGKSGTAVAADSLFGYIYDRVRENVADEDGLSQFEYGMIYEGGGRRHRRPRHRHRPVGVVRAGR